MRVIDAVKNLAVAIKGSGEVSDIDTDQIAEAIQYMADNWEEIKAGIGTGKPMCFRQQQLRRLEE